jgi:cobalt/nickel transport system ATP-binding protein
MLLATHDLPMVRRLCSRVILIDQGQVIADRLTNDLLADTAILHEHGVVE